MADGSDIVERLRRWNRNGVPTAIPPHMMMDEAAAEIERLRHDIDRHLTIASDLATEVERLRAQAPGWRMGAEAAARVAEDTTRAVARGDFGLIGPAGIGMRIAAEIRAAGGGMCSPFGLGGPADKPTDS